MASSTMQIACLASSLVFLLVYIPIVIVFALKLLSIRYDPTFKSRLSHIALITIASVIIHMIVSSIYLLELGGYIPFNMEVIQYIPYFILSYSLLLRFGLYHFQIQFEYLTDNQEWKAIIDGNMHEEMKTDWYLTNKSTYGSWKWLIKRFWLLPFLGGIILPIIIHLLIGNINNAITATVYFIALILMIILSFLSVGGIAWIVAMKLEEFNDVLYVLHEFAKIKWLSVLTIIGMGILIGGVTSFSDNIFEEGHDNNILILMLMEHLAALLLLFMGYFSSWWVVTQLVTNRHVRTNNICGGVLRKGSYSATQQTEMSYTADSITITSPPTSPKGKKNKTDKVKQQKLSSLHFLLSHNETMDLYMLHLKKEFQEEILLSLIEFTQFRTLIDLNLKEEEKDSGIKRQKTVSVFGFETLQLSADCPYSSILKNDISDDLLEKYKDSGVSRKILTLKYKTHLLFNKYVKSGIAKYEINISYGLRKKLDRDFGDFSRLIKNDNYSKLHHFDGIWTQCLEEQWKYNNDSILRFRKTEGFKRIKEHFAS